jgi:hypothetical protein
LVLIIQKGEKDMEENPSLVDRDLPLACDGIRSVQSEAGIYFKHLML